VREIIYYDQDGTLINLTGLKFDADIIDSIAEIIIIMDPQRNICAVNEKAADSFPNIRSAPKAQCYNLLFGAEKECENCSVKKAISTKKSQTGIIQPIAGKIWRVKADPVVKEGQIRFIVKRIEEVNGLSDIEKKLSSLNSELQRSNQDLEQFAYAVSHDLREPLRMIASYLQLLEMENNDKFDEESKEFMSYAFDGAKRMNDLLDGLLQYSRVGTRGKVPQKCDCKRIVSDATDNLMLQIEESGARVVYEGLPEEIIADRSQLIQLFSNLISNSIKYAKKDTPPVVNISSKDKGDVWEFCVSDNGIGIEQQYYERIFQVFQRLHGRTAIPGYGLGLSICKRIIERHGGKIWVESKFGEGTEFFFTLPKETSIKENTNLTDNQKEE
jgi:signal transduction histidine kinase